MRIILLLLIACIAANAENYQVPLSEKSVSIDGVLDDDIWQDALMVNLPYEIEPDNTRKAAVETRAYIIDNGRSILFAFEAMDPEPNKIRAFLRDRDASYRDDYVGVMLDTYNDQRRALQFFVNPLGAQIDSIRDESGGGTNEDDSWDAIWDSAGKITDQGYVVEMEIPYYEIQMPTAVGEKTWGINLFRSYPRDVRKQIASSPNDRNNSCFLCQIDKYTGFANAQRGRDLEITPSITMISNQKRDNVSADYSDLDHNFEPSLDVNWGINSNLTLTATLNPDFSQVESDAAQLDLNQTFALFFPERRPFFLENSDFFNTRMRLLYTRNIAAPDYGLRLVGKNGKNAYGIFVTDDTSTNILIPGVFGSSVASLDLKSQNIAARYRRDFGNASTIGAMITKRSADDYSNTVSSIDTTYRITDEDTISFQYATTDSRNPQALIDDFDQAPETQGDAYIIRYQHNENDYNYRIIHFDYDDGFRADLGFIGQIGQRKSIIGAEYIWRPDTPKWWNRINLYSDWDITHDQNGRLLEKELEARFNINALKQSRFGMNGVTRQRLWNDVLFDENRIGFDAQFQPTAGITVGTGYSVGDSIDFVNTRIADRTGAYVFANLNVGQHLSVNLDHSFRKLNRDGGNVFIANQTDLRLSYQFNIRQRLRLALINTNINRDVSLYESEVDSHTRRLNTQLIYSYKVNPKTLLFLGYSDAGIEDQDFDLTRTNRTLFAKFSYAWKI